MEESRFDRHLKLPEAKIETDHSACRHTPLLFRILCELYMFGNVEHAMELFEKHKPMTYKIWERGQMVFIKFYLDKGNYLIFDDNTKEFTEEQYLKYSEFESYFGW